MKIGLGQNFTEAVVMGKRYTGPEAVKAGIVQSIAPGSGLLSVATQQAQKALSQGAYNRTSLKNMKESVYQNFLEMFKKQLKSNQTVIKSVL